MKLTIVVDSEKPNDITQAIGVLNAAAGLSRECSTHGTMLDASIESLYDLPGHARQPLRKAGVHTIGDLTSKTADFLLGCEGFGETCLVRVRELLKTYGLHLDGESILPEPRRVE